MNTETNQSSEHIDLINLEGAINYLINSSGDVTVREDHPYNCYGIVHIKPSKYQADQDKVSERAWDVSMWYSGSNDFLLCDINISSLTIGEVEFLLADDFDSDFYNTLSPIAKITLGNLRTTYLALVKHHTNNDSIPSDLCYYSA